MVLFLFGYNLNSGSYNVNHSLKRMNNIGKATKKHNRVKKAEHCKGYYSP